MEQPFIDAEMHKILLWDEIRLRRDNLLRIADVLINKALDTGDDPAALRQYRQALRDLPQSTDNPDVIVWPVKPE